ncbi:MAG: hypothetical protein D6704_06125 [Nitrospirae bacterium]|nr:MAG: hypothetical protein D6704_06125 [Nitrospirota bacterium]
MTARSSSLINNTAPVDPTQEPFQTLFKNVQGNIVKGHGRDYAVHLLMKFKGQPADVRTWLGTIAQYLTSAFQQEEHAQQRGENPHVIFANVFLSADGYRYLNLVPPQELLAFHQGMKRRGGILNDPSVDTWELPYRERIDGMILLACDDRACLPFSDDPSDAACWLGSNWGSPYFSDLAELVTVELGRVLTKDPNSGDIVERGSLPTSLTASKLPSFEHFGYRDGISQPLFLKGQIAGLSVTQWDPFAPLSLVLVQDPLPDGSPSGGYGSFLVFRKLQQDCDRFQTQVEELAARLAGSGHRDLARTQALIMGRFQDGRPVSDPSVSPAFNDFDFTADRYGMQCPLQAHIRKANPRGETAVWNTRQTVEKERRHRIVRRGIPYGLRRKGEAPQPPLGLLFMCYQANIAVQFEHLQGNWANNRHFPLWEHGIDPISGQGYSTVQRWPTPSGCGTVSLRFSDTVRLRGGEYFFAPSLNVLRALKK